MFKPGIPLLLMLAEIRVKFRQAERISVLENEYITEKLADLTWRTVTANHQVCTT
jgi:hypothetical protein